MRDTDGLGEHPPKLVYGEVARVLRATGAERDVLDAPFDARPFVGQEVVVVGAEATPAQDG